MCRYVFFPCEKETNENAKHMIVSIRTETRGIMRYFSRILIFAIWMETAIDAAFAADLSDIMTYAKKNSPTLQQYLLTRENSKLAATAETVKAGISVTISTVQAFVKYLGEDVNQFVCGELDVGDTVSLNVSSSKAEKTI